MIVLALETKFRPRHKHSKFAISLLKPEASLLHKSSNSAVTLGVAKLTRTTKSDLDVQQTSFYNFRCQQADAVAQR
jgi:hypothetical protein